MAIESLVAQDRTSCNSILTISADESFLDKIREGYKMMNSVKNCPPWTLAYQVSAPKMGCGTWETVLLCPDLAVCARICFAWHMTPWVTSEQTNPMQISEMNTTGLTCAETLRVHTSLLALNANVTKAAPPNLKGPLHTNP
jgi:hypothetical protein